MIVCKNCGIEKVEDDFPLNRTNGREYRKTTCKDCDNKRRLGCPFNPPLNPERSSTLQKVRAGKWRKRLESRPTLIVRDARRGDKDRGRENDLDKDWVREQIDNPCSYCGETNVLMTLDRIDNAVGHLKSNVVPACGRCNYLRRDMPFEAWKVLIPAVKEAREKGLFQGWDGFGRKRKIGSVAETQDCTGLENRHTFQ